MEAASVVVGPAASARRHLQWALFTTIALVVTLGIAVEVSRLALNRGTLLGMVRLFGLGEEANVPTWYSSAALLLAGLLAGAVAILHYQQGNSLSRQWLQFASLLTLMSLDETASIHEMPSVMAYYLLNADIASIPWYVYYAWIAPGAVVLAGVVWWCTPLWRSLSRAIRRRFSVAAAVYFGGALGLEVGEALWTARFGREGGGYSVIWTLQETCEMVGIALLILALFDYIVLNWTTVSLRLRSEDAT